MLRWKVRQDLVVLQHNALDRHKLIFLTSIFFETTFFTTAGKRSAASFPFAIDLMKEDTWIFFVPKENFHLTPIIRRMASNFKLSRLLSNICLISSCLKIKENQNPVKCNFFILLFIVKGEDT